MNEYLKVTKMWSYNEGCTVYLLTVHKYLDSDTILVIFLPLSTTTMELKLSNQHMIKV